MPCSSEVAAAEPAGEAPAAAAKRGIGLADEIGEPERRMKSTAALKMVSWRPPNVVTAKYREIASSEPIRPGYRHELKQLVGSVVKAAAGNLVATMLQISQTENPMCSATIDQIKLRRAMICPWNSRTSHFRISSLNPGRVFRAQ